MNSKFMNAWAINEPGLFVVKESSFVHFTPRSLQAVIHDELLAGLIFLSQSRTKIWNFMNERFKVRRRFDLQNSITLPI